MLRLWRAWVKELCLATGDWLHWDSYTSLPDAAEDLWSNFTTSLCAKNKWLFYFLELFPLGANKLYDER